MTESIPNADDTNPTEQAQSVDDALANANEIWVNGVVEQWDADLADALDRSRPPCGSSSAAEQHEVA